MIIDWDRMMHLQGVYSNYYVTAQSATVHGTSNIYTTVITIHRYKVIPFVELTY